MEMINDQVSLHFPCSAPKKKKKRLGIFLGQILLMDVQVQLSFLFLEVESKIGCYHYNAVTWCTGMLYLKKTVDV